MSDSLESFSSIDSRYLARLSVHSNDEDSSVGNVTGLDARAGHSPFIHIIIVQDDRIAGAACADHSSE